MHLCFSEYGVPTMFSKMDSAVGSQNSNVTENGKWHSQVIMYCLKTTTKTSKRSIVKCEKWYSKFIELTFEQEMISEVWVQIYATTNNLATKFKSFTWLRN